MKISKTIINNFLVLEVAGRLDSNTSSILETFLNEHLDLAQSGVILDILYLDYISSAGLRVVLNSSKVLKRKGSKLIICRMQEHIREIFEISGFDLYIDVCSSIEEAIKRLQ